MPSPLAFSFLLISLLTFSPIAVQADRTITVTNNCATTIWPALFNDPKSPVVNHATGWVAAPGTSEVLTVPTGWSGRIWGREQCTFDSDLPGTCLTGGCNGGLLCNLTTGTGVPPATLAEFTIDGNSGVTDYYDVSNVDGFNIPVELTNTGGGNTASCPINLNPGSPDPALEVLDPSGEVIGCKSSCYAGIGDSNANCCTGPNDTAPTCPSSGVEYYSYFKTGCPNAYAYAYDESSESSLFTLMSSTGADYTVTFCPGTSGDTSSAVSSTSTSATSAATLLATSFITSTSTSSSSSSSTSSFTSLTAATTATTVPVSGSTHRPWGGRHSC